jgi:NAD-dependent SIR2 family protein deacetylase
MNDCTRIYWDNIELAIELIKSAEMFIVGIGSGMTSAGGLCYTDTQLALKWYPEYFALGKKSILDIMSNFWPTILTEKNATAFWGFWAKHIYHIRYESDVLQPYTDLFTLLKNKRYFICSTNVDGQLEKAGFDGNDIFAPQGDYALFQCQKACSQEVYNNRNQIYTMLENMTSSTEIRRADIPLCPTCGSLMVPNLRCDNNFVEAAHVQKNAVRYNEYLEETSKKICVLLECGVGFNTPGIIRFPLERMVLASEKARLIRVNISDATIPTQIAGKSVGIEADVGKVLNDIIVAIK